MDRRERGRRCAGADALATGAKREIKEGKPDAQMVHDSGIDAAYRANAETLGREFFDGGSAADRSGGSTDMGNVSLVMPSIHPLIGINSLPAGNHQPEFAEHCATKDADQAVYDGALAMAWTAIDIAADDELRERLMKTAYARG